MRFGLGMRRCRTNEWTRQGCRRKYEYGLSCIATLNANYRQTLSFIRTGCIYSNYIQADSSRWRDRHASRANWCCGLRLAAAQQKQHGDPCRFQSITAAKTPVFNQPMSPKEACAGSGQGKSCETRLEAGDLYWRSPDTHNGSTWATRKLLR